VPVGDNVRLSEFIRDPEQSAGLNESCGYSRPPHSV